MSLSMSDLCRLALTLQHLPTMDFIQFLQFGFFFTTPTSRDRQPDKQMSNPANNPDVFQDCSAVHWWFANSQSLTLSSNL
jgi:hypothetical protein